MNIFGAVYDFIQAVRDALIGLLQPVVMPDWGWLIITVLPLALVALVLLYFVYLGLLYRRNAWANADRRPARLSGRVTPPAGVHESAPSWWPIELSLGFFFVLLGYVSAAGVIFWFGVIVLLIGTWGWLRSASREWGRAEQGHGAGAGHAAEAAAALPGPIAQAALPAPGLAELAGTVPVSRAVVPAGTALPATLPGAARPATYEHAEPPEGVHMPTPSWWPVYASLAAFFGLLGLVANIALLVAGIMLAILAAIGWYVDSYRELRVAEGVAPRPHVRDPLAVFPRVLATIGTLTVLVGVAFAVGPGVLRGILPAGGTAGSASPSQCVPAAKPEITASQTKFSTSELCLPANVAFELVFHNHDQVQHNVAIGTLFTGEVFSGPGDRTYKVPALQPGQYKFICVVHPTVMFGTATVVAGGAGGAAPAGGGPQPNVSPSTSAGALGSPGASPGSGSTAPPAGATAAPTP